MSEMPYLDEALRQGMLFSEDHCRDLAGEHEQASGHRTTAITSSSDLVSIWCDDCDWHVISDR